MQKPQTENERVIDSLVTHRERLETTVDNALLERALLDLFLTEVLDRDWERLYHVWQSLNAKELAEWRKNYKEMWGM